MADVAKDSTRRLAHVIDDAELGVRCYPRGTRQLGEPCHLAIVMNSEPVLNFDEEAGDHAPRELVIDITTQCGEVGMLLSALATRPWASADSPVIICADVGDGMGVCYLIRTRQIEEILEIVRDGLDIRGSGLGTNGQVRLDAAFGGG